MDEASRRNRRQFISAFAGGAAAGVPAAFPALAALESRALAASGQDTRARAAGAGGLALFDVKRFGAVADGKKPATRAFQQAIDTASAVGGGLVLVPPGRYLCGALFLRSNIHVHVSAGATLLASDRAEDYPPIQGRWEGIERKTHSSLFTGIEVENVAITGFGVLEGQGPPWWKANVATVNMRVERGLPRQADNPEGAPLRWPRPRVINLIRSQGIALQGLTIRDGPSWNVHLVYCHDVVIEGVTLQALEAQNCDGIVIDSCKQVRIAGCSVTTGSDCISLKSGYNEDGRRVGLPCEDITITNCNMSMSRSSALAIGSETSGGIKNISVANCVVTGCEMGVYVKSPRGRGGIIERIRVNNLVMDQLAGPAIVVTNFFDSVRLDFGYYQGKVPPKITHETDRTLKPPVGEGTPTIRELEFSGLTLGDVSEVAVIEGLPERYIQGLSIRDVAAGRPKAGVSCTRASEVSLSGITVNPVEAPAVSARDVERLEVHRLRCGRPEARAPLVQLENVVGAFIHGCDVSHEGESFVRQKGDRNRGVVVASNNLGKPGARG
jgi:polygalacturonase